MYWPLNPKALLGKGIRSCTTLFSRRGVKNINQIKFTLIIFKPFDNT